MTTPTNHWKLGLFVVVASACAFGFLIWLGTQSFRKETVSYVSYFDESVTGLEIGSPVSFRGVRIGNVSLINIAPDHRHVEVSYELGVSLLSGLGLAQKQGDHVQLKVPDDVRVQVASSGVTGVKYVKLDFLPNSPIPTFPFPVPENYIPASPSTMKNLEDSVMRALDKLPLVVDTAVGVLQHADALIADLKSAGLPQQGAELLTRATRTIDTLQGKIAAVDTAALSLDAKAALAELNQVLARAHSVMARVDSEAGLLDSVQRATDAVGDVASNARGTGSKLDQTLDRVSDVAHSMQRLLDVLERDPDMLLKGRARSAP